MIKIIENNDYGYKLIQLVHENDFSGHTTEFHSSDFVHSNIDEALEFFEYVVSELKRIKEEQKWFITYLT